MSKIFVVNRRVTLGVQSFVRADTLNEAEEIARAIEPEAEDFLDDEYEVYEMDENDAKKLDEVDLLNGNW